MIDTDFSNASRLNDTTDYARHDATMDFLKLATLAPLNNFGPVGMMVAVILWIVALYYGVQYAYSARRVDSVVFIIATIVSLVMVTGLCLMLFTTSFNNQNGAVFQFYGLLQLLTFGAVGGFILLMAASCGFVFGLLIRMLDRLTQKSMR